jgi:hypothetical protein
MDRTYECPWCDGEIEVALTIDDDGGTCPLCQKEYLVEFEYVVLSEKQWETEYIFTLLKPDEPVAETPKIRFE